MIKQDKILDEIEESKRQDGKYRQKVFEEDLKGFSEIESGVVHKVRIDIPKIKTQELFIVFKGFMECKERSRW
jgi:hypothetical protein